MTMATEVEKQVRPILDEIKRNYFNDNYEASDEEAMGILMSQFFSWDGIAILTAAGFGLEDSNFHTLNGKVDRLIAAELKRAEAAIRAQKRAIRAARTITTTGGTSS